ncbi:hypothetical protein BD414DRAFT_501550 [Trametes punicea]|nr:hypothetical protein BD414DRAFT_501550 [Trametes punicea]
MAMKSFMLRTVLYTIASFVALAVAQVQSHDPNPPVLIPNSATVWTVGDTETVTWDTTGIVLTDPAGRELTGQVVLGYLAGQSQLLYQTQPLAQGFLLSQKQTQVVVPNVPSGIYFIALEGDTGNWSPNFKIVNPSEPSGTPPKSIVVTPVSSGAASTTSDSTSATSVAATTTQQSSVSAMSAASGSSAAHNGNSSASDQSTTSSGAAVTTTGPPSSVTSPSASASQGSSATVLAGTGSSSAAPSTNTSNGAQSGRTSGVLPAVGLIAICAMML